MYEKNYLRRRRNTSRWFAPSRFGLFFHWGLYTGGGSTHQNPEQEIPLTYSSPGALEAAAPDPSAVAENMVRMARLCGARYITLSLLHTNGACCVIYPTAVKAYRYHTNLDYAGAFLEACRKAGIRALFYMPAFADHWESVSMGPTVSEDARTTSGYVPVAEALIRELAERYGEKISGFWIDGMNPDMKSFPAYIRRYFPKAIIINNNNTSLDIEDVDCGTTEFLSGSPEPSYCRPSALRTSGLPFYISIPGHDFNEDIPTCCGWWHHPSYASMKDAEPYLADRRFLLRQMISSLGQHGQWNFALGIGPMIDGNPPPEFVPSLETVRDFMEWGGESIYGTTGGEGSRLFPGYFTAPWSPPGFCSVTRSLKDSRIHYILVTDAPPVPDAMFRTTGGMPSSVTDLRTGKPVPFRMLAGIHAENVDWSDVETFGVKVLKVIF